MMKRFSLVKIISDENHMLEFGASLAEVTGDTAVIYLYGDLGAGKTTFARGFLRGLHYTGKVKSPTYTLVEPYELEDRRVFHFDLYRLQDSKELHFIGVQDYFVPGALCLVEWPEQGAGVLPPADIAFHLSVHADGREVQVDAHSELGKQILKKLICLQG